MKRYKRFVSYTSLILMAIAFVLTFFLLCYYGRQLHTDKFFVSRTRVTVTREIDFENVTTTEVRYYLYRNTTVGASDINPENNYYIASNVSEFCGNVGYMF